MNISQLGFYAMLVFVMLALVALVRPELFRPTGDFSAGKLSKMSIGSIGGASPVLPYFAPGFSTPFAPLHLPNMMAMAADQGDGSGFFGYEPKNIYENEGSEGEQFEEKSWLSDALNKVKVHELQQLFGSQFDGNIKTFTTNLVTEQVAGNGAATLAEVKAAADAAIPALVSHLTPFLPAFLRPFAPELDGYAATVVNGIIDSVYKQVVAAATKPAAAAPAKSAPAKA